MMKHELYNLIAFLAVLLAIIVMFGMSAYCLSQGKSVEAIGIGGVMTGLIGVLGTFRPRMNDGAAVRSAETVNIENK